MRKTQFAAIVVAVLLVAGCSSSGETAPQPVGSSSTPSSTFEADANEPMLSADEALWQARNEIGPELNAAGKRFEKYLLDQGASSDLSNQLFAMLYVCEAKGLNRYDVAYAESYYITPVVDGNGDSNGPTVFDLLESGDHLMLTEMTTIGMASCKNREAIAAMD